MNDGQSDVDVPVTRRSFLGSAAGAGMVASLASWGEGGPTREDLLVSQRVQSTPYPESPYIVTAHGAPLFVGKLGWERPPEKQLVQTYRQTHTDLLDYHRLLWPHRSSVHLPPDVEGQIEFALNERLPGTSGQTPYVVANEDEQREKYGWIREHNDWRYPDGSPVERVSGIFAMGIDGSLQGTDVQGRGRRVPSVFASGAADLFLFTTISAMARGFVGEFYDSVTVPRRLGLDFSEWAQAAFRSHLSGLGNDRLDELGVEDPASFDVRAAFRERGIEPGQVDDPATDALYREFCMFHHRGLRAHVRSIRNGLLDELPERRSANRAVLYANQFIGDKFYGSVAPSIYLGDEFDLVNIEDDRTLPPEHVRDFVYKTMESASRGEKPVLVEGEMHQAPNTGPQKLRGLDPTRTYTSLMRLQIAEAYANGVPRKLSMTSWANIERSKTATHWVSADGMIPEELRSFADFLWTRKRYLADTEMDGDVALLLSMPTFLWTAAPQWGRQSRRAGDALRGCAKLLREAGIPYDVRILGHERLWDDAGQLDSLADYDAVVLPASVSLGERHREALEAVLDSGGRVVVTDGTPARDEWYEEMPFELGDRADVFDVGEAGVERTQKGTTVSAFVDGVRPLKSVDVAPPAKLGVTRRRQADPDRLHVHLLNYDYSPAEDAVASVESPTVTVRRIGFEPAVARWESPAGSEPVTIESVEGGVRVQLPTVETWGFLSLAAEPDGLQSPTSAAEVRDRLDAMEERIDASVPESSTEELAHTRAEVVLDEARTAFEAGAYELVPRRLERASTALKTMSAETEAGPSPATSRNPTTVPTSTTSASNIETEAATPGFDLLAGVLGIIAAIARHRWFRRSVDEHDR